ncbi:Serine/threonine-protein kinase PknL [Planctomycetes bacterium Poly30]|uniref:Serine/threonine-protein kinase PknL n=1 Tax=Saltatorellus ferox TaxID=2528018 RepID=A0A518EKJ5_9BACT|nr:Serine/threonine-protein kinase PknL [Planctomycetes bacterium Poly30]
MTSTTTKDQAPGQGGADAIALQRVSAHLGDRYEIVERLSESLNQAVYRAVSRETGESVAIKRISPVEGRTSQFSRELHTLLRLDNDAIVRLLDLEQAPDGTGYLILEHCAGGSLRDAMRGARQSGQGWSTERAVEVILDVARGLEALHRAGHVHADIKPENVLFSREFLAGPPHRSSEGGVKLADFGLARASAMRAASGPNALSGTPAYMAPERFRGELNCASDLYSLGVLAYELLHGSLPFEGGAAEVVRAQRLGLPAFDAALPAPWPELLGLLLEPDEQWRLDDAQRLISLAEACPVSIGVAPMPVVWKPLPPASLGVLPGKDGEPGFVVGRGGITRYSDGAAVPVPFRQVDAFLESRSGVVWVAADNALYRSLDPGLARGWERIVELMEPTLSLTEITDAGRDSALLVLDVRRATAHAECGAQLWSVGIESHGAMARIVALGGDRLAIASGSLEPSIRIFEGAGKRVAEFQLPGIVWHMAAADTTTLHLDVVAGDRMRSLALALGSGRISPMPRSQSVALRAHSRAGRSLTVLRSGVLLEDDRPTPTHFALDPDDRVLQALQTSGSLLACVEREGTLLLGTSKPTLDPNPIV